MEIKFVEKEICRILKDYVQSQFGIGPNKEIDVQEKYNDYIITVVDLPKLEEKESENV